MMGKQRIIPSFTKSMLLVLGILESVGPITSHDIAERLSLPKRTVTYTLRRLIDEGLVRSCPYLLDTRQTLYAAHIEGLDPIVRDNLILRIKEAENE